MFDMLGKLNEVKKAMDEMKARLETISVDGEAGEGSVRVVANGNKVIKSVSIADNLMHADRKEELEELIELAVNRALNNAQNVSETEMKAAGKGILPNIPGLF